MPQDKLFFIAIIAPDDVAAEINIFKHDIRDNYSSKAALKTMPHITLKAPFKLSFGEREGLLDWFSKLPIALQSFPVVIKNFGCFNNRHNKVIYVKPVMSDKLAELQSAVISNFTAAYPKVNMSTHEHQFSPHMTIGYRDLTPENFDKAWAAYSDKHYQSAFLCQSISLLQHNGMKWEVVAEKSLSSAPTSFS